MKLLVKQKAGPAAFPEGNARIAFNSSSSEIAESMSSLDTLSNFGIFKLVKKI